MGYFKTKKVQNKNILRTHKKHKKTKLENLSRLVGSCKYCSKDVHSDDSFVALVKTIEPATYDYAHYQCMKDDDERNNR
jgi:glucose-6-phosphate 1-dehydrogenase